MKEQAEKLRDLIEDKPSYVSPAEEKGYRDEFIKRAVVDVVQRGEDVNIIIYLMPGEKPHLHAPIIKRTCIDVFGHKKPENIDTVFYPKNTLDTDGAGITVGGEFGMYDSFCVVLGPPNFYTLEQIKDEFARRLYFHMGES